MASACRDCVEVGGNSVDRLEGGVFGETPSPEKVAPHCHELDPFAGGGHGGDAEKGIAV